MNIDDPYTQLRIRHKDGFLYLVGMLYWEYGLEQLLRKVKVFFRRRSERTNTSVTYN